MIITTIKQAVKEARQKDTIMSFWCAKHVNWKWEFRAFIAAVERLTDRLFLGIPVVVATKNITRK